MNTGFDSLADAVRSSFPEKHCRLLDVREHGDFAVALFDTRPTAEPYLYEVHYERLNGRWSEGGSGNGAGWHSLYRELLRESLLGVMTLWDEAPAGADKVRAELEGRIAEENVTNGIYLFAWWDVPSESFTKVTEFRINGQWIPAPGTWVAFDSWDS